MQNLIRIVFVILITLFCYQTSAQQQDSIVHQRKNIIKFNLTSNSFLDNAILFEYERVLKNNRSFTVQSGYNTIPFSQLIDSSRSETDLKKTGWSATLDYRFYLKKENKFAAPHGIYVGPFMSYHSFSNERSMELQTSTGTFETAILNSKISLFSIGGEIGYQFVIKNRWTIDLLMFGPSVTNYNAKMKLTGNLPAQELDGYLKEILDGILDNYPFVGDLLEDNTAEASGRVNTWDFGFRYSVHVGFCF